MSNSHTAALEEAAYLRQRLDPEPADPAYLHLSDLRMALASVASPNAIRILDFGCGGSPYRSLFPNAEYRRADFPGAKGLDYVIDLDGRIKESDGVFDLVLSTQVLEHCRDAHGYLQECLRLLRPGGRLVCSTHGTFEDHACPNDFQRWTADGLRLELERAGFGVSRICKVTCGPRLILFLMQQVLPNLRKERGNWFSRGWRVLGHVLGWLRTTLHRGCDRYWSKYRVMEANSAEPGSNLYVVVFAEAFKPTRNSLRP